MTAATLDRGSLPLAEQARQVWASDPALSARALAEQFGRSPRWARERIREARESLLPASDDRNVVEVAGRVDDAGRAAAGWTWPVAAVSVAVVALVALALSYSHLQHLAAEVGETGWRSWLLPVSVDGLMLAASVVLLARRRAGVAAGWLPWVCLAAGVAASVAANIAQAQPDVVARLVAAWPPLAALAGVELLLSQARQSERRGGDR